MEQFVRISVPGSGEGFESFGSAEVCVEVAGSGAGGGLENEAKRGRGARAALLHVVSYSDPAASRRAVPGLLDDYAFTALACLDAYEATADLDRKSVV